MLSQEKGACVIELQTQANTYSLLSFSIKVRNIHVKVMKNHNFGATEPRTVTMVS